MNQDVASSLAELLGRTSEDVSREFSQTSSEDTSALYEAIRQVPDLVRLESPPAATFKQLADYWSFRTHVFGENWKLRLTGSLLSEAHQEEFKSIVQLPNDQEGNRVIYINRSNQTSSDESVCLQTAFNVLHTCLHEQQQPNGLVLLFHVSAKTRFHSTENEHILKWLSAFPCQLKHVYLAGCPPAKPAMRIFQKGTMKSARESIEALLEERKNAISTLVGVNRKDLLSKLESCGFAATGLPKAMGGTWKRGGSCITPSNSPVPTEEKGPKIKTPVVSQNETMSDIGSQSAEDTVQKETAAKTQDTATFSQAKVQAITAPAVRVDSLPPTRSFTEPYPVSSRRESLHADTGTLPALITRVAEPESILPQTLERQTWACLKQTPPAVNHGVHPFSTGYSSLDSSLVLPSTTSSSLDILGVRRDGKAVHEAMNLVPACSKMAYMEAMRQCPRLVEMESEPERFLLACDYNAVAAAVRLASYWEFRKSLFGSRAFLPLISTGNGALTNEEIVLLAAGAAAILPPDKEGSTVVCLDRSRLLGRQAATVDDRLRIWFYLAASLAESDENLTNGVVIVNVLITPRYQEVDVTMSQKLVELLCQALPVKIKRIHLNVCPPKSGKKGLVERTISTQMQLYSSHFGDRACLNVGETPEMLFAKLRSYGLSSSGLPPTLGGTWKYEDFNRWLRDQGARELRLEPTLLTMGMKPLAGGNGSKIDSKERKRLLNIIHSRQKRERRRAEMEEMDQKKTALTESNKRLRVDNVRIETLLVQAQDMAEKIEKGEPLPDQSKNLSDPVHEGEPEPRVLPNVAPEPKVQRVVSDGNSENTSAASENPFCGLNPPKRYARVVDFSREPTGSTPPYSGDIYERTNVVQRPAVQEEPFDSDSLMAGLGLGECRNAEPPQNVAVYLGQNRSLGATAHTSRRESLIQARLLQEQEAHIVPLAAAASVRLPEPSREEVRASLLAELQRRRQQVEADVVAARLAIERSLQQHSQQFAMYPQQGLHAQHQTETPADLVALIRLLEQQQGPNGSHRNFTF